MAQYPKSMNHIGATKVFVDQNREEGQIVGLTNGCFDLFHPGHVHFLEQCRRQCDVLVVGINSDLSIKRLKGPSRPIVGEVDRHRLVQACRHCDHAFVFNEMTFESSIMEIQPNVWFKGGDYSLDTLTKAEVEACKACHTDVRLIPYLPGWSTTTFIDRMLAHSRAHGWSCGVRSGAG